MSTACLDRRDVLPTEFSRLGQCPIDKLQDARHENLLGCAFDQNHLVGEIEIALRQRHILLKKCPVLGIDSLSALSEILDFGLSDTCGRRRFIQKVTDRIELRRVREMR